MKHLTVTHLDEVAYVKLNRPEVRNAFHPEMIAELNQVFTQINSNSDVRAVILFGEGRHFCAGADLNWMKSMVNYTVEQNIKDSEELFAMFSSIRDCHKPVVGLVHGAAFGGALGLLACCDYVVAEEAAQFCFSEVKIGLSPAVISHFIIPKISQSFVAPLMISGQVFTSTKALHVGLVHDVVKETKVMEEGKSIPQHEMHHKALKFIENIKNAGPEAVFATKQLVQRIGTVTDGKEAKTLTTRVIAERRVSAEGQEGLKSFLEKRKANWIKS